MALCDTTLAVNERLVSRSILNKDVVMPSSRELPQRFSWVTSESDGARALPIIGREASMPSGRPDNPQELVQIEVQAAALGFARASLNHKSVDDLRCIELRDVTIPGHSERASGFRLLDIKAIREGRGSEAELVTVIFGHGRNPSSIIPIVIPHKDPSGRAVEIKEQIDSWWNDNHPESRSAHAQVNAGLVAAAAIASSPPSPSSPSRNSTEDTSAVGDLAAAVVETAVNVAPVVLPDSHVAESAVEAIGSGIEAAADSGVLEGLGDAIGGIFDVLGGLDF